MTTMLLFLWIGIGALGLYRAIGNVWTSVGDMVAAEKLDQPNRPRIAAQTLFWMAISVLVFSVVCTLTGILSLVVWVGVVARFQGASNAFIVFILFGCEIIGALLPWLTWDNRRRLLAHDYANED